MTTLPRLLASISWVTAMASGTVYWTTFLGEELARYTTLAAMVGSQAASADSTASKLSVWELGNDKSGTMLVYTTHDVNLFTVANAMTASKTLSVPVVIRPGVLYAVGAVCVGATTTPKLQGVAAAAIPDQGLFPQPAFTKAGYTDFPSAFGAGSTSSSGQMFYARLS